MKQTNSYQFNLVESGDAFSPAPLNENMEKVEAALGVGGSTCRIASGSYEGVGEHGTSHPCSITVPFYPTVVIVTTATGNNHLMLFRPATRPNSAGGASQTVTWTDSGVSWFTSASDAAQLNDAGVTYYWVAFGTSL